MRTAETASRTARIPTLDGWRGLAVLMVIAHHASTAFYSEADFFAHSPTRFFSVSLDIFFALSGLLICKQLLEELDTNGSISLGSFYVRRCCRILPPLLAFLGVVAALGLFQSRLELASCLFFFRNYMPQRLVDHSTAHLYSLSVEEHFYLLWPALLVVCGKKWGARVAVALAIGCGVWRFFDWHYHWLSSRLPEVALGARTDLRFDELMWGCIAAFALHRADVREWLVRSFRFVYWLGAVVVYILIAAYQPPFALTWTAATMPLLLLGTVAHPHWLLSRLLETAPLRWLGRVSYGLYMWQALFLIPSWLPRSNTLGWLQQFPLNLAATFLLAAACYRILESPLMRLGRRLGKQIAERGSAGSKSSAPKEAVA